MKSKVKKHLKSSSSSFQDSSNISTEISEIDSKSAIDDTEYCPSESEEEVEEKNWKTDVTSESLLTIIQCNSDDELQNESTLTEEDKLIYLDQENYWVVKRGESPYKAKKSPKTKENTSMKPPTKKKVRISNNVFSPGPPKSSKFKIPGAYLHSLIMTPLYLSPIKKLNDTPFSANLRQSIFQSSGTLEKSHSEGSNEQTPLFQIKQKNQKQNNPPLTIVQEENKDSIEIEEEYDATPVAPSEQEVEENYDHLPIGPTEEEEIPPNSEFKVPQSKPSSKQEEKEEVEEEIDISKYSTSNLPSFSISSFESGSTNSTPKSMSYSTLMNNLSTPQRELIQLRQMNRNNKRKLELAMKKQNRISDQKEKEGTNKSNKEIEGLEPSFELEQLTKKESLKKNKTNNYSTSTSTLPSFKVDSSFEESDTSKSSISLNNTLENFFHLRQQTRNERRQRDLEERRNRRQNKLQHKFV